MTSATTAIHRSKGFNPAGPHYTGITFKKGHTTPQTAIDRAKFADCPTGNPSYAPTITSAEYRQSVAAYKASGAQRPFHPSTLETPENRTHETKNRAYVAAERRAAELAEHTCVDCGLDQMGNGQTIYLRTVESKGTWLDQPTVKAVLCTSCYDARKAVMHAAEEAARITAHCRIHTDLLLHGDGSCPECSRWEQQRLADIRARQIPGFAYSTTPGMEWMISDTQTCQDCGTSYKFHGKAEDLTAESNRCSDCANARWQRDNLQSLTDAQLATILERIDTIPARNIEYVWAELERRTAPAECALTHAEPRILAMAGGSQDAPNVCQSCLNAAESNLHCEDRYGLTDQEIEAAALVGYSLSHACESPAFCQCGYTDHPTPPESPPACSQHPDIGPSHGACTYELETAYIGCDFLRTQPDGQPASTCNRPATYRARRVRGHSDLTLNCCPDCVDRAKRRGYELTPLDAPEPSSGPAINSRPPMSPELRRARAIQKASETRAHVRALPDRPGYYLVRSATEPHERYVVAVNAQTAAIECSCKAGSEYRQPCWHAAKVESRIIRESRRVAA